MIKRINKWCVAHQKATGVGYGLLLTAVYIVVGVIEKL
jgi:hypothetical protein